MRCLSGEVLRPLEQAPSRSSSAPARSRPASCGGPRRRAPRRAPCSSWPRCGSGRGCSAPVVQCLADHPQVRLPHVRADELDLAGQLLADEGEELARSSRWYGPCRPTAAACSRLDLIDQGQDTCGPCPILDLIDADGADRCRARDAPAPTAPHTRPRGRPCPRCVRNAQRRFLPRQLARPVRQKQHVGLGQAVFAHRPGHVLDPHAASSAHWTRRMRYSNITA